MTATLHPNGFRIRLLATFRNGMRLRLHTWERGVERLETPHNHRSWFVSVPLWGRFTERRFVESEDGKAYDVRRCHATTSNGKPFTTPEGQGDLREVSATTRYPFVPYVCRVGAIHSFVPRSIGRAASLVLFGPPKVTPRAWVECEDGGTRVSEKVGEET